MIARIIVGAGDTRTAIALPTDRDTRRTLGNKLKGALFASNGAFKAAKARGEAALVAIVAPNGAVAA